MTLALCPRHPSFWSLRRGRGETHLRTHHSPRGGLANCDSCAKPGSLPFVQLRFYGNIAMLIYLCAVYGRSHVTKLSSPNGDCMAHRPNLLTPEDLSWPLSSLTPPPSCPVSWRVKAPLICPRPKAHLSTLPFLPALPVESGPWTESRLLFSSQWRGPSSGHLEHCL